MRAALSDLVGDIIAETVEATDPAGGLAVIAQVVRMARVLAKGTRVPWRSVRSVAVGCPGFVTVDATLTAAVNIAGFDDLAPRLLLEKSLHLPVLIENDVKAAAFGEFAARTFGPIRNLVVISIRTGVGAGIIRWSHPSWSDRCCRRDCLSSTRRGSDDAERPPSWLARNRRRRARHGASTA